MAVKKSAPKTAQNTTTRKEPVRQAITLEAVIARAPHGALAENLSRTFGLDCPEYAAIREGTEENIVRSANVLRDDLNDKAMEIHLQRVVGSFVSSAFGASTFYQTKVTTAKDFTMASQNDSRDEDRDPVSGFQSKAENARLFAAQMGLQAYALFGRGPRGAVHAYAPHHRRGLEALRGPDVPPPAAPAASRPPRRWAPSDNHHGRGPKGSRFPSAVKRERERGA